MTTGTSPSEPTDTMKTYVALLAKLCPLALALRRAGYTQEDAAEEAAPLASLPIAPEDLVYALAQCPGIKGDDLVDTLAEALADRAYKVEKWDHRLEIQAAHLALKKIREGCWFKLPSDTGETAHLWEAIGDQLTPANRHLTRTTWNRTIEEQKLLSPDYLQWVIQTWEQEPAYGLEGHARTEDERVALVQYKKMLEEARALRNAAHTARERAERQEKKVQRADVKAKQARQQVEVFQSADRALRRAAWDQLQAASASATPAEGAH